MASRRKANRIPTGPDGKPRHALTADAVLFEGNRVLVVERGHPPFAGSLALPGGFVEGTESAEAAVLRELMEETGLRGKVVGLVGLYSAPGRDPRGPTATAVFLVARRGGRLRAGDDAAGAQFIPITKAQRQRLAFDHNAVLADALRIRAALAAPPQGGTTRTRRGSRSS